MCEILDKEEEYKNYKLKIRWIPLKLLESDEDVCLVRVRPKSNDDYVFTVRTKLPQEALLVGEEYQIKIPPEYIKNKHINHTINIAKKKIDTEDYEDVEEDISSNIMKEWINEIEKRGDVEKLI